MKIDEQLLNFFDIHKDGLIKITHPVIPGTFEYTPIGNRQLNVSITVEDLYRMIKLKLVQENESVHMD